MVRILIHGAGKLGQAIIAAAQAQAEAQASLGPGDAAGSGLGDAAGSGPGDAADGSVAVVGAVDGYLAAQRGPDGKGDLGVPLFSSLEEVDVDFDVVVDSSRAEHLQSVLDFAVAQGKPVIVAATGHTDAQLEQIAQAAQSIAVLRSSNLSVGVNVVRRLVADAARMLGPVDTEIVEAHHRMKIDAPSGTALTLAEAVRDASDPDRPFVYGRTPDTIGARGNEIGIHAVRGGSVVGEHTVTFLLDDEIVEVRHVAQSRQVFGFGALKVAQFIVKQPAGVYSMEDLLG